MGKLATDIEAAQATPPDDDVDPTDGTDAAKTADQAGVTGDATDADDAATPGADDLLGAYSADTRALIAAATKSGEGDESRYEFALTKDETNVLLTKANDPPTEAEIAWCVEHASDVTADAPIILKSFTLALAPCATEDPETLPATSGETDTTKAGEDELVRIRAEYEEFRTKAGARNSSADKQQLQSLHDGAVAQHDTAVGLGADCTCSDPASAAKSADLRSQTDFLSGEIETKSATSETLTGEIATKSLARDALDGEIETKTASRDALTSDIETKTAALDDLATKHAAALAQYDALMDRRIPRASTSVAPVRMDDKRARPYVLQGPREKNTPPDRPAKN